MRVAGQARWHALRSTSGRATREMPFLNQAEKKCKLDWAFQGGKAIITNMMNIVINSCCSCTSPEATAGRRALRRFCVPAQRGPLLAKWRDGQHAAPNRSAVKCL